MTGASFHLFSYGTLRRDGGADGLLASATYVRQGSVEGTLYDIGGSYPALMLYGSTRVTGDIWRCPADLLAPLDHFESVAEGLFRRIGVEVAGLACWTYVAGPALARRLTPDRRIPSGNWLEYDCAR